MSFIHSIQSMLPRPENRSRDEIARDVEDELAFHLEMRTRAIEVEEGVDRAAAGELARARFGDVDRIRNECQRIALKERSMLQRVNFIMMLVVLVMVAIVGWQVLRTQARTTEALTAITGDLQRMKFDASNPPASHGSLVYLDGDAARPGQYNIPTAGLLTLDRLITAAGGVKDGADAEISVEGVDDQGKPVQRFAIKRWSPREASNIQYVVKGGDRITIKALPSAASAPAAADAGDAARVLVEGDVLDVGWHAIDMNRGTRMSEFLERVGTKETQWVTYRRAGADHPSAPKPVDKFVEESGMLVLRPNDELAIHDDVAVSARRGYFLSQWRTDGISTIEWRTRGPEGEEWNVHMSTHRNVGSRLEQTGNPTDWSLTFDAMGVQIGARDGARRLPKSADWDVRDGQLVIDFATLRDDPRMPPTYTGGNSDNIPAMPSLRGKVAFERIESAMPTSDSRAAAVGDFVVRLFALADPRDPDLDQKIREFLDSEEKALDAKFPDDPATAAMIKELIAGRRKIFDADAAFHAAASAEAREKAVTDFLTTMLSTTDAPQPGVSAAQVLDVASQRVDQFAGGDAELAAAMRDRIQQARSAIQQSSSLPQSAPADAGALVRLDGDVVRPGVYNMPTIGVLTLERVLTAAGGVKDGGDAEVNVDGWDDQGKPVRRVAIPRWSSRDEASGRFALKAGDRVTIKALPPGTASSGSAPDGGMSDAELQKFIPRLMTASIPNSAASSLPTLEELNRAAVSIDIAYAKDPTLLAKLHGMMDTVRARLNAGTPTSAPATQPGE